MSACVCSHQKRSAMSAAVAHTPLCVTSLWDCFKISRHCSGQSVSRCVRHGCVERAGLARRIARRGAKWDMWIRGMQEAVDTVERIFSVFNEGLMARLGWALREGHRGHAEPRERG